MLIQNSRSQCLAHILGACGGGAEQGRRHKQAERQPVPATVSNRPQQYWPGRCTEATTFPDHSLLIT